MVGLHVCCVKVIDARSFCLDVGPIFAKAGKMEMKHQENKYCGAGPKSKAMQRLNKEFSLLHCVCYLLDVVEITTVWYGLLLLEHLMPLYSQCRLHNP